MKYSVLAGFLLSVIMSNSWSQIMSSLPSNGDTLIENEPNLVWQCLTPYLGDPRYSLTLTVSPMEENQTPLDAIVSNIPILFRENLTQNAFTLTSNQVSLLQDTWYAWQVTLLYNNVPLQQSEPWKFIISIPEVPQPKLIALRKVADNNIHFVQTEKLQLSTQDNGSFQTSARLIDNENNVINVQLVQVPSNTDLRIWEIDLEALDLDNGIYRFEWPANKKYTYTITIEI